jgi:hypothetical protein
MSEENKVIEPVQESDQQQGNEVLEKEARVFGWVPKEEFRGSDDDWVDADTFVKRGKEINPILRKNNELLMKKLDEKAREIDTIKKDVEQFKKFQRESFDKKKVELESEIVALKSQKRTAIAEGNGDLVVDLDDRIDELKEAQREAKAESKAPPPQAEPTPVAIDPDISAWLDRNKWFGQDTELTEMSNALGANVRKQFPHLTGREFLDKIDEKLAEHFPEKFMGKKPKVNSVDSSGSVRSSGSSSKKSYDNLPQEAKTACDRFIKNGWIKSKQEYIDSYDWS